MLLLAAAIILKDPIRGICAEGFCHRTNTSRMERVWVGRHPVATTKITLVWSHGAGLLILAQTQIGIGHMQTATAAWQGTRTVAAYATWMCAKIKFGTIPAQEVMGMRGITVAAKLTEGPPGRTGKHRLPKNPVTEKSTEGLLWIRVISMRNTGGTTGKVTVTTGIERETDIFDMTTWKPTEM